MPATFTFGLSLGRNSASRPTCSATAIPALHNVSSRVVVSPLSAPCSVTATTAPVSRSTACSALCARCVRPSFIFAIRASGSCGCVQLLYDAYGRPIDKSTSQRNLEGEHEKEHPNPTENYAADNSSKPL